MSRTSRTPTFLSKNHFSSMIRPARLSLSRFVLLGKVSFSKSTNQFSNIVVSVQTFNTHFHTSIIIIILFSPYIFLGLNDPTRTIRKSKVDKQVLNNGSILPSKQTLNEPEHSEPEHSNYNNESSKIEEARTPFSFYRVTHEIRGLLILVVVV